jgi:Uma2 family endonuclease
MSAASKPQGRPITVAEFLAYDDGTDTRYELVNGALVAMNPPSGRHADICENIADCLRPQLVPPCRVYTSKAGAALDERGLNWREPDVLVACTRPEAGFFHPRLVVEVLSPSTEKDDRTTKLDFYESLPSVEAILLVWQDERRVRLRERGEDGWHDHDVIGSGAVRLAGVGARLTLGETYHDPWTCAGDEVGAGWLSP